MNRSFITFSDMVDEAERIELYDYALKLKAEGLLDRTSCGLNGVVGRIWDTPLVTPLIGKLAGRIVSKLCLENMAVDQELGWVISVVDQGGFIKTHVDRVHYRNTEFKHLRCNIVISKPEQGGWPIVGNQVVPVVERGGWGFFASEIPHSAFPVGGRKPRIIYQFGYSVPKAWNFPEALILST